MAKATIKVTKTVTRTRKSNNKSSFSKSSGSKRCPACGRYMK